MVVHQSSTSSKLFQELGSKSTRPSQSLTMFQMRMEYRHLNRMWLANL
jgi:hypothetical protein